MKKILLALIILITLIGCSAEPETHLVRLNVEDGGYVYTEIVTQASIGDYGLPLNDVTDLHLEDGRYQITWTWTNINGFGMHMNPTTEIAYIDIDEDMCIHIWGQYVYFE